MEGLAPSRPGVPSRLRWRVAVGGVLLASVALGGCQAEEPAVHVPDFVGVVGESELTEWVAGSGDGPEGGPLSGDRAGPGHIRLRDGTTIEVPPDTPAGGTECNVLTYRIPLDEPDPCLVLGEYVDDGPTAAWFDTLPLDGPSPWVDSTTISVVGLREVRDGAAFFDLSRHVLVRFDLANTVALDLMCTPGPRETVPAEDVDVSDAIVVGADLDLETGRVARIHCVGTA